MKNKLKYFIFSLLAVVLSCGIFATTNITENSFNASYAASPISNFDVSKTRSNGVTVTNTNINSANWIASGDTKYQILELSNENFNYFTIYSVNDAIGGEPLDSGSNGKTLIHESGKVANSNGGDTDKNAQFVATISLSDEIKQAMSAGVISLESSATLSAKWIGNVNIWVYKWVDTPETITMEMAAYNDASSKGSDIAQTSFTAEPASQSDFESGRLFSSLQTISLSYDKLTNSDNYDNITLSFKSSLNGDCYNYMRIDNPTLKIVTNDLTGPEITSVVNNTSDWTKSKTLTITANDIAGVKSIEVKDNGEWKALTTTSGKATHEINENGVYYFRAIDNVGNVSEEFLYEEKNIDIYAPIISAETSSPYLSKDIDVVINSLNLGSAETYTYKCFYTHDILGVAQTEELVSEGNANGNDIEYAVNKNGTYRLEVLGSDALGNAMTEPYTCTFVCDTRQRIALDIETSYTYNPAGFSLVYEKQVDEDYDIGFSYFLADGETTCLEVLQVGNYNVSYVIDTYDYYANNMVSFVINPQSILISNMQTSYYYTESDSLIFDYEPLDVKLNIVYKKDGVDSEFLNVGTYDYEITSVSSNYVVSNGTGTVEIEKYQIELKNIVSTYEYDNKSHEVSFEVKDKANLKEYISINYYLNGKIVDNVVDAETYKAVFVFNGDTENYTLKNHSSLSNALDLVISKRNVEVSVNSQTKTYGEELAPISYTATRLLETETLNFDLTCDLSKNVGYYPITINQKYSLSETEQELFKNYNITYKEGFVEILKKDLQIVPDEAQSKIYGNEDGVLTYRTIGLEEGDDLSGELGRENGENVGYYNITLGTLENGNYNLKMTSSVFEIVKRVCFVFVASSQKTYGELDPMVIFDFSKSNILENDKVYFKAENVFVREAGENVGSYKISLNPDFKNSEIAQNYVIISTVGFLKINKAPLFVSADSIDTIYGETKELTYSVSGLVANDDVQVELTREIGENVGDYDITLSKFVGDNYEINFTPAVYSISPKQISIIAIESSKTYGEIDSLSCQVVGTDDILNIELLREIGENVGEYQINDYIFDNSNFEVISFVGAKLSILPAKISVSISNSSKTYGETDAEFEYVVDGLKKNDEVLINITREAGENAGNYKIKLGENNLHNYVIDSVKEGVFEIKKANISFELNDKTVVYSGEKVYVDEPEIDFELKYSYTWLGSEIEVPTNAGEYKVVAIFEGNANYNAFKSEPATIIIEKKIVPIAIKNLTFLYDGKQKSPEYEINLNSAVSLITKYENDIVPVEIGSYNFKIISNDPNYYAEVEGTVKIVDEFYTTDSGSSASMSTSNVSFSGSDLRIILNSNSKLMNHFNPLFDGKKCVAVYEFANVSLSKQNDEIFTVRLKAVEGDANVEIYAMDKDGNLIKTAYSKIDGYYVFAVNNLSSQILITKSNNYMFIAKVVLIVTAIVLTVAITKTVNRKRLNKFFEKNTSVKKFNKEEVKENIGIVNAIVDTNERFSYADIVNDKK